jgi:DsbC/DsbD-like thiol-disulfide interchange protein
MTIIRSLHSLLAVAGAAAVLASSTLAAQPGRPRADVKALVSSDGVHAGTSVKLALDVRLPKGLHTQSNTPRDPMLIPTVLTLDAPAGVTVSEIVYPAATDLVQAGQTAPLAVFGDRFAIGVAITLAGSVPPGEIVVPGRFRYQACDATTCFAPAREAVTWTVRVVPAAQPTVPDVSEIFDTIHFSR